MVEKGIYAMESHSPPSNTQSKNLGYYNLLVKSLQSSSDQVYFKWHDSCPTVLVGIDFDSICNNTRKSQATSRPILQKVLVNVRTGQMAFSLAFFQISWDVKKGFVEFHMHMKFNRSLNATFIVLIPKKANRWRWKISAPLVLWGESARSYLRSLLIIWVQSWIRLFQSHKMLLSRGDRF